jgi:hypothetical protein
MSACVTARFIFFYYSKKVSIITAMNKLRKT